MTAEDYARTYGAYYRNLPYKLRRAAWNHHCSLCDQTIFTGDKYFSLDLSPREFKHEVKRKPQYVKFDTRLCLNCVNITIKNYCAIIEVKKLKGGNNHETKLKR